MVKKLHKASVAYPDWKQKNNPNYKPWHFPEQIVSPRIRLEDVSIHGIFDVVETLYLHSCIIISVCKIDGRKEPEK